jgi:HEAT repeat protein
VVNVASRIEKLSKRGRHTRVLFSGSVEEKIRGLVDYEALPGEPVRGKHEEVKVYELIGIRDLQFLIRNLKSEDAGVRRRSVELLGHSRNPEASGAVLAVLEDPDEGVRIHAALAVSRLSAPGEGSNEVVDRLIARLRAERSAKVTSALIQALGRICRSEKILELTPFLDSNDERVVANTIEAMGQSRTARAADLILPKLNSHNNRIKANAAMALFAAGHYEVIETLKAMLMHSEPLMRSSAAFAIGELTLIADISSLMETLHTAPARTRAFLAEMQQCVPMLVALLRDPDPMVKRQSVIALGKIRDRSAVLPMIEMIEAPGQGSRELSREILESLRSIGSHRLVREVLARLT